MLRQNKQFGFTFIALLNAISVIGLLDVILVHLWFAGVFC